MTPILDNGVISVFVLEFYNMIFVITIKCVMEDMFYIHH